MTYAFGQTSLNRLHLVHPNLVKVLQHAIANSTQDFMILEGVRSKDQMCINYGKGRTAAECEAKGVPGRYAKPSASKVTWLAHPLESKHGLKADGFGHAVDTVPYPVDFNTVSKYDAIAKAIMGASKALNIRIRWGADWDMDNRPHEHGETDLGHFELT